MAGLIMVAPALAAWSGFALYLSYVSITDVQQYEEQTEQAAKWSSTAENQLHWTRTTEAAGAAAVGDVQ